ncbi:exodeoxyribonuclease VII small subunit [Methylobacillus sp. Pita2]|uniref:exodeoxyribonuclease VII small subunit n=1 Tax=Methylobacillus sp. Pita2 TaxID=3383245 RepID=UPI0038B582D5
MTTYSQTYAHHYSNLKGISEKIRNQTEPDIDQLVPLVDSALASVKFCKERIAQVKAILGDKLPTEIDNA